MTWTRRRFLVAAGGGLVAGVGACRGDDDRTVADPTTEAPPSTTTTTEAPVGPDPFTLGVASGDPDHTSVVLWTHVERPAAAGVEVEVATDEAFTDVVWTGTAAADPSAAMTVRVTATGLGADTVHWYRFALDGHRTPPARTRTAPAPGAMPGEPVRIAHLSCQRFSAGYWMALDDVADAAPDVIVHCGDYVYGSDHLGDVRPVDTSPPESLDDYRALWRRYRTEPELQAAHRVAPWLVVWDDHEVENNYQGGDPSADDDVAAFLEQRAAAYRAWWEFTPTRLDPPDGPALRMHRHVDWGRLTRFVLLDTRQHRDPQPCEDDLGARCDATDDVSMLGAEQERWVGEVVRHDARWTTVVQQVVLHQWQIVPGNVLWNLDQWDGYTGARRRFLDALGDAPSPVVLTGDVHSSWVADLPTDFDDPDASSVGVEFVAPGISSAIPEDLEGRGSIIELQSPHIAWSETERRGWVLHTVDGQEWHAEYRLVEDATMPGSPIEVAEEFTIRAGERRLA